MGRATRPARPPVISRGGDRAGEKIVLAVLKGDVPGNAARHPFGGPIIGSGYLVFGQVPGLPDGTAVARDRGDPADPSYIGSCTVGGRNDPGKIAVFYGRLTEMPDQAAPLRPDKVALILHPAGGAAIRDEGIILRMGRQ